MNCLRPDAECRKEVQGKKAYWDPLLVADRDRYIAFISDLRKRGSVVFRRKRLASAGCFFVKKNVGSIVS